MRGAKDRARPISRRAVCISVLLAGGALGAQGAGDEAKVQALAELKALMHQRVRIASRVDQRMRDAPAVVSVIGSEEMRLHGWRRLSEALEQIPGFATRWQAGGDQGLVVRGMFAPDGVLVMVDGVAINSPLDGNTAFHDFPLEGVERIEIARGPGSALYGGYAFVAVVNLITSAARPSRAATAFGGAGGSRGSASGAGWFKGPFDWGDLKVHASLHRLQDRTVTVRDDLITALIRRTTVGDRATDRYGVIAADDGRRAGSARQGNVGARIELQRGPFEGVVLDASYAQRRTLPVLSRLYALVDDGRLERRDDLLRWGATWPWNPTEEFRLTTRLYGTSIYGRSAGQITRPYGWDDDEDFDGITERWPAGRIEARFHLIHTGGLEVRADFARFRAHTLNAGLVAERSWLARTQYLTNSSRLSSGIEVSFRDNQVVDAQILDPKQNRQDSWILSGREGTRILQDIRRTLGALYLQDIWQIRPGLAATLGLRLDSFSRFGTALTPRAALVWDLSEKIYLKGIYGEAFKPPSFLTLYDGTVTLKNARQVYGNPDLKISTIRTGEIAFGYQARPGLLLQANIFLTRTRDEIVFNGNTEAYRNEASRRTRGVELEAQAVGDRGRLHLSYALQEAEAGPGSGAPLYPRHQAVLGIEGPRIFDRLDLGLTLVWHSAFRREAGDPRPPLPASTLLQAQAAFRLRKGIALTLGGSNLLDEDRRSPVDRALADTLPGDIPRPGRQMEAGLHIQF